MNGAELEESWVGELGTGVQYPLRQALRWLAYRSQRLVPGLPYGLEFVKGYHGTSGFGLRPWNVVQLLNVIEQDDRAPVNNTEDFPWRCVCALDITARDGTEVHGTGWFIGPGTLITAGHCVYRHENQGEVDRIEVFPGRDGVEKPFGSCEATEFRYPDEWKREGRHIYDYGAIILPRDRRYGTDLGHFGFARLSDPSLDGLLANLSGYPGDKPPGTQWFHARPLTDITGSSLRYKIDTFEGHSGAPLWWLKDGKRYVVGIHNAGSNRSNHATRINRTVFDNLKKWKAERM
jgi:glutamyl endopeptidase